ncbi:MAG: S-layer homology domain-containing protein [Oscillospiraceae bacterium]|nr:S-layer homology domain-containing protein [Oscillospiraceae bacterium]
MKKINRILVAILAFALLLGAVPASAIHESFFETHADWHFDLTQEPDRPMTVEEFIALTTAYSYWAVGIDGESPTDRDGNLPSDWAAPYIRHETAKGVIKPAQLDYDTPITYAGAIQFIVNSKGLYDINAINLRSFRGQEQLSTEEILCLNTAVDYGIITYDPNRDVTSTIPRRDLEAKYKIPEGVLQPVEKIQQQALSYDYTMAFIEDCYWDETKWQQTLDILERNSDNFNVVSLNCLYLSAAKLTEKQNEKPGYANRYASDFIDGKFYTTQLLNICKEQGILRLGGVINWYDSSVMEQLKDDPAAIEVAAQELMDMVRLHDLDGLNLDIEIHGTTYRDTYSSLIRSLSAKLHAENKLLMVSAGGYMRKADEENSLYDYEVLSEAADLVTLITYDIYSAASFPYSGAYGEMSNRTYLERCLRYAALEMGAEKLLIGLSSYGIRYNLSRKTAENVTYDEVLELQQTYNAQPQTSDTATDDCYFTYQADNCDYVVCYESRQGMKNRIAYATRYGLGGTAMFHLASENQEFFQAAAAKQSDLPFEDVVPDSWYAPGVEYAWEKGLFNGITPTTFEPDTSMTRAMLVTVLWRAEGSPEAGEAEFSDVPKGIWYSQPVAWAASQGIVNGVGGGKFDPDSPVTRQQIAAILYRYAAAKGYDTASRGDLSAYPDEAAVAPWAKDALSWAVAEKYLNGTTKPGSSAVVLDPNGNATRAQVATILMRFLTA